jgi:hypothetical protein
VLYAKFSDGYNTFMLHHRARIKVAVAFLGKLGVYKSLENSR